MALTAKKFGAHLAPIARSALAACTKYPPLSAIKNPLTRKLVRRVIERDWDAMKAHLDFDFTLTDATIGGVPCVTYDTASNVTSDTVILYVHGGAFVAGSARANASSVLPACWLSGARAVAVDYALAPEHTYPEQHNQIERVYQALCDDGVDPNKIIIIGDSAGANLAITSCLRWRDMGLALPAGIVLMSGLVDAAGASDTLFTLRNSDPLISTTRPDQVTALYSVYAGAHDPHHPYISAINADLAGLPPMLIQVGAREVFLGDSARLAEKARQAGVDVSLRVFDGMFHLFQMNWALDEAKAAQKDMAAFIATHAKGVTEGIAGAVAC